MATLKYSITAFVLLTSCAVIGQSLIVEVDNGLASCVAVSNTKISYFEENPVLSIIPKNISSTAACGCKSAVNSYSAYQIVEGNQMFLMSGEFSFLGRTELKLPIAAQKKLISSGAKVKVVISCANPD